jgi:hypothetical protein
MFSYARYSRSRNSGQRADLQNVWVGAKARLIIAPLPFSCFARYPLTRPRVIAMTPQRHQDRQNHRTQLRGHALDQLLFVKGDDPANFLE